MHDIGFMTSKGGPDVWMHKATKPCCYKYYEYVIVYVGNILCCSHQAETVMKTVAKLYCLKKDPKIGKSYTPLEIYLGGEASKYELEDDMND